MVWKGRPQMKPSRQQTNQFLMMHTVLTTCFLVAGIAATAMDTFAAAPRPNILFLFADDWAWPHASCLGTPVVKTPTFDRLAKEGVLFRNAHTAAPSCSPSRAAILTGQWHWRLEQGANLHGFIPAKFAVYPDLLEKAGYFVGLTGKGLRPRQQRRPSAQCRRARPSRTSTPSSPPARRTSRSVSGSAAVIRTAPIRPASACDPAWTRRRFACRPTCRTTPPPAATSATTIYETQQFDSSAPRFSPRSKRSGELDNTLDRHQRRQRLAVPALQGHLLRHAAPTNRWPSAGARGSKAAAPWTISSASATLRRPSWRPPAFPCPPR